jgi:enoyl-CoA hydratase/carnithine racemase
MSDKVLLTREENGIGRLILNQPEKRNALSREMWQWVAIRVNQAVDDPAIKVLVVQGMGGSFAAGADISEFESAYATRESTAAYAMDIAAAMDGLANCCKPTLALIRGACVGGGMGLALACDLRFAAEDAKLGITPAKLGLVYPLGDTRRLVQTVGASHAKDLLFTGRLVDATEAHAIGLVDHVVPMDRLEQTVAEYAGAITANSQWSARAIKKMIGRVLAGQQADDQASMDAFLDAVESPDFIEGRNAFKEKRKPSFPFS